ncbi:hypothetical protein FLONG3_1416 [Fusarium longipes]|uniref:Uncharacterized protein n=1 Tax=Fusarium longipes TaxID=694270 RepID=A0A395T6Z9_9HYPO|nr:hypothetical protein FLONG3_1416 [Fusarium longipes]
MDAVAYDNHNHSSYARAHQNQHHQYPHNSALPLPVPGAHGRSSSPHQTEGEGRYQTLDALPPSLHVSTSLPMSEVDTVFSVYQSTSTQASIISRRDVDMSGPPPPPHPPLVWKAGLGELPPPPSYLRPPMILPQSLTPSSNQTPFDRPPPPPPPGDAFIYTNLRPPLVYNRDAISSQQQSPQQIPPPPPPETPTGSAFDISSGTPTQPQAPNLRPPRGFIGHGQSPNAQQLLERKSLANLSVPRATTRHDMGGSTSRSPSSTYTIPRLIDDLASSYDSPSDEDSLVFRNSRQFPPLYPTASTLNSQGRNRKTSMTNRITTWISEYERDRAPKDRLDLSTSLEPLRETTRGDRSHISKESVPSEDNLEHLWVKLKGQRVKLNDIKTQMAKKRKKLRELRRKRDDADNAFMGIIRPILIAHQERLETPPANLERRLADLQRLRTEYQASENDYEDLEVILDEEEEILNKLEIRFFSLLAVDQVAPQEESQEDEPQQEQDNNMPNDLMGILPNGPPEDVHPLFLELMATVGDLENAKEELNELMFLKEQHEGELRMKSAAGMELNEAEIEFFDEFPLEEEQMRSSVTSLEQQVTRLRNLCEEKGAMKKHLSSQVSYLLYPEIGYEDIELDTASAILRTQSDLADPTFPMIISQPEHVLAEDFPLTSGGALKAAAALPATDPDKPSRMQLASKEYSIDRLMLDHGEGGKGDFINRWLLHQLRLSSTNARLLHTTFTKSRGLKIRDLDRWQSDVLHYWWNDEGAELPEDMVQLVTSEHSNDGSRVGTNRLSKAVTYTPGMFDSKVSQPAGSSVAAHSAWD